MRICRRVSVCLLLSSSRKKGDAYECLNVCKDSNNACVRAYLVLAGCVFKRSKRHVERWSVYNDWNSYQSLTIMIVYIHVNSMHMLYNAKWCKTCLKFRIMSVSDQPKVCMERCRLGSKESSCLIWIHLVDQLLAQLASFEPHCTLGNRLHIGSVPIVYLYVVFTWRATSTAMIPVY